MGFYEEKGKVRYTVIVSKAHKDVIEDFAATHGLSQGEVVEVLVDTREDPLQLEAAFKSKREDKTDARKKAMAIKKGLISQVQDLSPEQLAELEKSIARIKADPNVVIG